jgi:hypothetical protein
MYNQSPEYLELHSLEKMQYAKCIAAEIRSCIVWKICSMTNVLKQRPEYLEVHGFKKMQYSIIIQTESGISCKHSVCLFKTLYSVCHMEL